MKVRTLPFLLALFLQVSLLYGQVRIPRLISDGAVFQRDTELRIWGWASTHEEVHLTFKNETYKTKADQNGDWSLLLPAQKAGGPYNMVLRASNTINIENILFGDVWICSGQSNMELPMERVKEKYTYAIKHSENPNIRQFIVPDQYDFKKEHNDLEGGAWSSANPENVLEFSAVAYFFARDLYNQHQIPIGLINAALGGSPVEAWMSETTLKKFPSSYEEMQKFKDDTLIAEIEHLDEQRNTAWYTELNSKDQGIIASPQWQEPNLNDTAWHTMSVPGYWSNHTLGTTNGVVWFRKAINLPKRMAGKPAKLWLGRIVDQDFAYINGELVGTTGYQYPPRRYNVAADVLKEGKNTIAIRVVNNAGKGGFVPDKPYYLAVDQDTLDLSGAWKVRLGAPMPPIEPQTFIRWKPGGLYNKMISPLFNFRIKGVIWFQGESNTNDPSEYSKTFAAMISNWRAKWQQGNFPFIFVQLANFMEETQEPVESNWAALRQEQWKTLTVPNTGMAVTIDLGEWNDIHPLNKEDVGKRLALQARKLAYHENQLIADGPSPKRIVFKKKKVIIHFKDIGQGLLAKNDSKLHYFSIAADGKHFTWAKAKIKGNRVIVWEEGISSPTAVRYAWSNNPATANLYSKNGLPAAPFEIKKISKKGL